MNNNNDTNTSLGDRFIVFILIFIALALFVIVSLPSKYNMYPSISKFI